MLNQIFLVLFISSTYLYSMEEYFDFYKDQADQYVETNQIFPFIGQHVTSIDEGYEASPEQSPLSSPRTPLNPGLDFEFSEMKTLLLEMKQEAQVIKEELERQNRKIHECMQVQKDHNNIAEIKEKLETLAIERREEWEQVCGQLTKNNTVLESIKQYTRTWKARQVAPFKIANSIHCKTCAGQHGKCLYSPDQETLIHHILEHINKSSKFCGICKGEFTEEPSGHANEHFTNIVAGKQPEYFVGSYMKPEERGREKTNNQKKKKRKKE